ncbi:unnamed protein product [Blumeria hordei]|uniref:Serine/threonine-protein kinase ATG1 n=1 Tax=Blumeria hordei TaxID=2867405 RepID=A0A383URQ1_BLUHO|nr:unnamed protein product [Blumeria hordei]
MSSAALQSTLVAKSPVPSRPVGRPYTSGTAQSREGYFRPSSANTSSPSARRPSRRSSGNGIVGNNNHSQTHGSSAICSPTSSTSSRLHSSSTMTTNAPLTHTIMSPGDSQRGLPPVVSPRTSSNRAVPPCSVAEYPSSSSRKGTPRDQSDAARRETKSSDGQYDRDRTRNKRTFSQTRKPSEDPTANATRTRNRQVSQDDPQVQQSNEALDPKISTTMNVRRKAASTSENPSRTGPSREASEVLNRIIVSQPEIDIERERERMAEAVPNHQGTHVNSKPEIENTTRSTKNRHEHAAVPVKREKSSKFGEYFLGGTLGEGEFGKVKMGWKQEGGVQVAIKLIRRDSVGTNPSRLAKIYREIAILREISHPNIVRLHEMVETEKQIGIILEYASGGELFDYILNHRYLKDHPARRLFSQLVSGVGYLHRKGIVHRDLKLENLLLDRNRNIIITDFGFANTFNAEDKLSEEIEYSLGSREFVKKLELDKILPDGHRRGDLMQTSCGSPCYAAPELVVSDSLYTGRKVDVWSCGVILYAMLAGYLPFDDDPANPEGDNINLLYKYIVSTPLTFPEYVSPHARDLLRRILVPDPRKRADLFEVARHSWLAEYAHVVSFITSGSSISRGTPTKLVSVSESVDVPIITRSVSVREPTKIPKPTTAGGESTRKTIKVTQESPDSHKIMKDNKRRTVQVEYVAPISETQRGTGSSELAQEPVQMQAHSRPMSRSQGQGEQQTKFSDDNKAISHDQPGTRAYSSHGRRSTSLSRQPKATPSKRCELPLVTTDTTHSAAHPPVSIVRCTTGGSVASNGSRPASMHLTSRGSYSQPVAPAMAGTNVQGRMSQPRGGKSHNKTTMQGEFDGTFGSDGVRSPAPPSPVVRVPDRTNQLNVTQGEAKGHRRSNTIGGFFSRSNSVFGGRRVTEEKASKKYPPVSMPMNPMLKEDMPRLSVDSRRSISFGFGKKRSGSISNSQTTTLMEKPRRFSLIPTAFSLKAIGIGKDGTFNGTENNSRHSDHPDSHNEPSRSTSARTTLAYNTTETNATPTSHLDGLDEASSEVPIRSNKPSNNQQREHSQKQAATQTNSLPPLNFRHGRALESESSIMEAMNTHRGQLNSTKRPTPPQSQNQKRSNGRGALQKNTRRFTDAYEQELGKGYGNTHSDHAGSSGAARKVMDFFRRRGRDRGL